MAFALVIRIGDMYWVGKIVELLRVVWDAKASEKVEGDVKVHEFGATTNQGWRGPQYPMYNKSSGTGKAKVVKAPSAHHTPLYTVAWAEAFAMWGSEKKMLQVKGRKLKKSTVEQLEK